MNRWVPILRRGEEIALASAIVCIALGLSVMASWYAGRGDLSRLHPSFGLMQFNTALAFLASGTALLSHLYRWRPAFLAGFFIVAGIGLLTLLQYLFGIDLGIDRLFYRASTAAGAPSPGRMGINTALCFALGAVALGLLDRLSRSPRARRRHFEIFLTAASMFVLAGSVLISYAVSALLEFRLGTFSYMSIASAAGFVALALGLIGAAEFERGDAASLRAQKLGAVTLVLILALSVTGVGGYVARSHVANLSQERFDDVADRIAAAIEERMRNHEQILLGGRGLFAASREVTREEWHAYVEAQQLQRRFPGIQGVGFSRRVTTQARPELIRTLRDEGFPDFDIHPKGPRAEYHAIVYLEPFDWRNQRAFGYDMHTEPTRREAMDRARDRGETAVSGRVTLVQETDEDVQAGFLMYVPVYPGSRTPATLEARRSRLVGYVYSPFRANDLIHGILGSDEEGMHFRVFDGDRAREGSMLFASHETHRSDIWQSAAHLGERFIETGGRTWTLQFASDPVFDAKVPHYLPLAVLGGGTLVSLLLFGITGSLATTRSRAVALADRMTVELRDSQQRFQAVSDTALDAIVSSDGGGRIIYANRAAEQLFGFAEGGLVGEPLGVLMPERLREAHLEGFRRFLDTGDAKVLGKVTKLVGQRSDGSEFPLELSLAHWRQGEAHFFTALIRDITERMRAEEKFRGLLESAPDAMVIADESGRIVLVNRQTETLFGYERAELLDQNVEILVPERLREAHPKNRRDYFANPKARGMGPGRDLYGRRKDGSEFPAEVRLSPLQTADGVWVSSAIRDVTERKRMEQAVYESEHRYRQLVDGSRGLICSHDLEGVLRYVNGAAAASLGYRVEEMVGKRLLDFLVADFRNEFPAYLERIGQNGRDSGLMLLETKDHEQRTWMYDNVLCQSMQDGQFVLGHAQDVSELRRTQEALKAAHDEMREMATHDGLTGLCNRQLFYEHLSQAIEYAKRYGQLLGVLFLDLDGFKEVNDTRGHSAGDQLLREVAGVLSASIRKSDVAARIGGDEFVILLRNVGVASHAGLVAEKIIRELQEPMQVEGGQIRVTTSIGVACHPGDGDDPEELVRNADTAMYHAKQSGRNRFKRFTKEMKPASDRSP